MCPVPTGGAQALPTQSFLQSDNVWKPPSEPARESIPDSDEAPHWMLSSARWAGSMCSPAPGRAPCTHTLNGRINEQALGVEMSRADTALGPVVSEDPD